jgi:acetyl-CoA carboxylase biotin carboxyl carrier protein
MMDIDIRKIKKIIELLENSSISEIEMKEGELSLRLSRHGQGVSHTTHLTLPSESMAPRSTMAPLNEAGYQQLPTDEINAATVPTQALTGHIIRSPMVGTFYSSSSPEAPPFVAIGQTIRLGEAVCIIEAMKMFNEIESDRAGVVIDVLVKNGDPVEYDQPLFIIE